MYTRKQALALARQLRTCPLLQIKKDPQFSEQVKRHTDICPFCSTSLKDELDAWDEFSELLAKDFPRPQDDQPVQAGQIWQLDTSLACFKDDFYYTPPQVLVLKVQGPVIQAAQVWQDTALAAPGDLVPPKDMIHQGPGELVIEPWNIYSLEKSFLGYVAGSVDPRVVEAVMQMDGDPDFLPSWALVPVPLKENDPRQYFQELEIEVGYTFAAMAVPLLMAHVQQAEQTHAFSLDGLITQIRKKIAGIDWDWVPQSIDACLAAVRFPDHALPMGAADDDTLTITAAYYAFDGESLEAVIPLECRIEHQAASCDPFSVSGVIEAESLDFTGDEVKGFIKALADQTLTMCGVHFDPVQRRFMAALNRPLTSDEQFSLVIIHQKKPMGL